ncbi:hypothetical protein AG1IA_07287 [Rhizoctonia solani AG-1 IA]|uniref:Uncharacterized protein n=1 Tax=Thanatephorus cucumeris (strain AG1-IA) TaxID=983506 RepID=L8WKF4_THACA|nr:hypothetical protein AG1IA_07287 [Rhizoctonia solani AG-1 IA]
MFKCAPLLSSPLHALSSPPRFPPMSSHAREPHVSPVFYRYPENQYISKRSLFSVGYGLKLTMLVCLPQHESDYRRIDT